MTESYLAKLYARSVLSGDRIISQVPDEFRVQVGKILEEAAKSD